MVSKDEWDSWRLSPVGLEFRKLLGEMQQNCKNNLRNKESYEAYLKSDGFADGIDHIIQVYASLGKENK